MSPVGPGWAHTCWREGALRGVSRRELYGGRSLPGQHGLHPEPCSDPLLLRPSPGLEPRSPGAQIPRQQSGPCGWGGARGPRSSKSAPSPPRGPCLSGAVGAGALLLTVAAPLCSSGGPPRALLRPARPQQLSPASPPHPRCLSRLHTLDLRPCGKGQAEGSSSVSPLDQPARAHFPSMWIRACGGLRACPQSPAPGPEAGRPACSSCSSCFR